MFEDFLNGLADDHQEAFASVMEQVAGLVPEVTEGRSYGLPVFMYKGKPLLGFAVRKNHLSLYPFSSDVVQRLEKQLAGRDVSKGTVRFTADDPLPADVVAALVRARVAEIEGG